MLGRAGSWVGNTIGGLALGRFWLYQDFAAGSGPGLTLTSNGNGSGGGFVFDATKIVDSSAVVTKTTGEPIFNSAAELPSQLVSVSAHTDDAVTLSGTPAVGQGTVRVWYLYVMNTSDAPQNLEVAPRFVKEERSAFLDTRFLNSDLNLSDLASASTARTNLGFNSNTSGRLLIGDGSSVPATTSLLFWDAANTRLGVNQATPGAGATLDVGGTSGGVGMPVLTTAQRDAITPARNGVMIYNSTTHAFNGYINGAWGSVGITDHGGLTGLSDDDHTIYALLAGRASGQTLYGDTASGGNLVLGSTAHATKGKIYFGASSYYQETVGSEILKIIGTTSNQDLLYLKGSAAATYGFGILSGALYLVEGSNEYLYARDGWITFGSGFPKYAAEFNQSATSTAPLTDIVQTSGTYNLPILAVRNRSNTVNTYSGIVFSGGSSSQEAGVQLVAVHESTTVGSESSHLDFNLRNAGALATRLSISKTGVHTMSAYGAGIAQFDSSGVISSTAPGTSGNILLSNGTAWASANRPVKSGAATISSSATSKAITFATAFSSTNYSISAILRNTTDTDPVHIPCIVIAKATTGFTVEWGDALPTGNYALEWVAAEHYDP